MAGDARADDAVPPARVFAGTAASRGATPSMTTARSLREFERGRENNFDALRVGLALVVILSHSYPLLQGSNAAEPIYRATGGQRTAGEVAVDGFFLISGYLITMSWQRSRGLLDYLKKRVLRIYPGFLVAVLFSSLVAAPALAPSRAEYWGRFDAGRFLIDAFNLVGASAPGISINGSLWSIRPEFLCYLGVAALGCFGLLRRRPLVLLATLGCTALYAGQILLHLRMPGSRLTWLWCYPDFWPRLAACYLAGTGFHLYADRVVHSGRLAILSAAALSAAASLPRLQAFPLLIPYLGGYLLFYLAYLPAGRLKDIARRGDLTYGLYLYAYPIQLLLIHRFGPRLTPTRLSAIAVPLTAAIAALSWYLVERPCLRLKRPRVTPIPVGKADTEGVRR